MAGTDSMEPLRLSATALRCELPELVPPRVAIELDHALSAILNNAERADVLSAELDDLVARLQEDDPGSASVVREWVGAFLAAGGPPGLPNPRPKACTCPQQDYTYYRPSIGAPVPRCPTHHLVLKC